MPFFSSVTTGATPVLSGAVLDPAWEEAHRKENRRRYLLRQVPSARAMGFLCLSLSVILHGVLVPGSTDARHSGAYALTCAGYCAVTWLLSLAWERRTGSFWLASAWFLADPWMWNLGVLWSGGSQSWLYVGLILGLGGFVSVGPGQVLVTGISNIAGYAVILAYQQFVLHRPFPLGQEVLKVLILLLAMVYLSIVARIVTSLKKQNRAFLGLTQSLNQELRTRAEELAAAKDLAEAQSQAKSRFLAGMSHELRTPLNSILLYSELIEGEAGHAADSALALDAHRIQGAGRHLLQLVNDLLDLSKIEAGRMELNPEPVDLDVLLEEVKIHALPLASLRGNTLLLQNLVPVDAVAWKADMLRLRQILLNLLGNAAKFTEAGKITLRVHLEGEGILFEVADTGIGMSEEQLGRIFHDFVQADPSIAAKYGGTGLGLTLSMRLCERMGGHLEVASQEGKGSQFKVFLPA